MERVSSGRAACAHGRGVRHAGAMHPPDSHLLPPRRRGLATLLVAAVVAAGCGAGPGTAASAPATTQPSAARISIAGSGLTDSELSFCNQQVWANLATAAEATGISITPLFEKIALEATPGAKNGLAALQTGNNPGTAAFGEVARHDPEYVRLCLEAVAESTQAP